MENLCSLSDDDLFRQLHELVATQRGCIANLIVHLAEADARRAHLDKGFSSLFVYCAERLHFSEDEACRRIDAARLSRRYPEVIELLRSGAVSLTALGIAKVHLTAQNRIELFAGISGKSTRAWSSTTPSPRPWAATATPTGCACSVARTITAPQKPFSAQCTCVERRIATSDESRLQEQGNFYPSRNGWLARRNRTTDDSSFRPRGSSGREGGTLPATASHDEPNGRVARRGVS
jgi:hypothetical protein